MTQKEMDEIAIQIESIFSDILLPARTEKSVNEEAFAKLEALTTLLKQEISSSELISRRLTGVLFSLYILLNAEAQYCKYDNPLFLKTAKFEADLSVIFGEHISGALK